MAIDSPCTKICVIGAADGLCLGCGRSLDEIAGWSVMAPSERRKLMALLPERMAAMAAPDGRREETACAATAS